MEYVLRYGFDIDGTISTNPEFYSSLSKDTYIDGGSIVIISSRTENQDVRDTTIEQLNNWSISYDKLFLFKPFDDVKHLCPHDDLNWYQKYLWQKLYYCIREKVDCYHDDDIKVIELFESHAPSIVIKNAKYL